MSIVKTDEIDVVAFTEAIDKDEGTGKCGPPAPDPVSCGFGEMAGKSLSYASLLHRLV